MRELWRNCKGAVTVMVTLLLIPAILITGTGVDLARIYSARSTLQDANQLAANSALASYNALLQDLYGLYGIMQDDKNFASMVDEYIKLAVFGEDGVGDSLASDEGSFALLSGSNFEPGKITPAPGKNLKNPAVLRRQIEEYSKFRAPAIIVSELLDKLDTFDKVQEDARVIKKKMNVDDRVEEVDKWYRKVYQCIEKVNMCKDVEKTATNDATAVSAQIHKEASDMSDCWDAYLSLLQEKKLVEEKLEQLENELASLSADDEAGITAKQQEIDDQNEKLDGIDEEIEKKKAEYEGHAVTISSVSSGWKSSWDKYIDILESYIYDMKESLPELKELCECAEKAKGDLDTKIQELESSLNSGKCSEDLKNGLTVPPKNEDGSPVKNADGTDMKSVLDQYKDLLEYDLNDMTAAMISGDGVSGFDGDEQQVKDTITILKDETKLGDYNLAEFGTKQNVLSDFPLPTEASTFASNPLKSILVGLPTKYSPAPPEFQLFNESLFDTFQNRKFFEELDALYGEGKGDDKGKSNVKNSVTKIFGAAKEKFASLFDGFNPDGAKKLLGAVNDSNPNTGSDFGTNDKYDWGKEDEGKNELKESMDSDFLSILANAGNAMGSKILLLVYDTEMFSDYSTPGQKEIDGGKAQKINMAGIPLGTKVNYYFQSELEYLYNGDLSDAIANLKSVAGMIFLIRFVFDYVASFSVSRVNTLVNGIKSALAWTGPFAILTGELARLAVSLGESALDVQRLRRGDEVAIYKTNKTWKFSVEGLLNMVEEEISSAAVQSALDVGTDADTDNDDDGATMKYTDYMRLFLLLVDGDTLALRTSNLIELNVTNYRDGINAKEEKMASATIFDMSKAITDFSLTTTVDLRMMFLSMPFAQKGVGGVIPPKSLPISVTDYRGY